MGTVFHVRISRVFNSAEVFCEVFKERGSDSLIITASISGHLVNASNYQVCYNPSKIGVIYFTKSLTIKFAGIAHVNTVLLASTDTPLSSFMPTEQRAKGWGLTPLEREALPKELVDAYLYLTGNLATLATGTDIRIDDGYCSA